MRHLLLILMTILPALGFDARVGADVIKFYQKAPNGSLDIGITPSIAGGVWAFQRQEDVTGIELTSELVGVYMQYYPKGLALHDGLFLEIGYGYSALDFSNTVDEALVVSGNVLSFHLGHATMFGNINVQAKIGLLAYSHDDSYPIENRLVDNPYSGTSPSILLNIGYTF